MAQATLTFTLPEESEEHADALHGGEYRRVLRDLDINLRARLKYETLEPLIAQTLQALRDWIREDLDGLPL